jgi:ABC-2 type transport system ATP-binding protein
MQSQEKLIKNALFYYERGDHSLGYRTLLDTALNTDSEIIFKSVLKFVAKYEIQSEKEKLLLIEEFKNCLKEIESVHVLENVSSNTTILKGRKIVKYYKKGKFTLGPLDIELKEGGIYGLVGENGNGKTTLLTVLASISKFDSGDLEYFFSDNSKDSYTTLSKLVYIPQRTAVWFGKVLDNLKFTLSQHNVTKEKNDLLVLMIVARFGLWKYKHLKWSELSSGYKMRFELARTILRKPEIIFLDEPLANLDILAQQIILEDLKMLSKSPVHPIAMIFSSQQLYEVEKVSDSVIYLKDGKPSKTSTVNDRENVIIELDTKNTRADLESTFNNEVLDGIEFNGGVYILYFKKEIEFNKVLSILSKSSLKITYIRDISKSTRRFFIY